jgi:hypothetical protein
MESFDSPTEIELANHKQVAAYVVALGGMLEEEGKNPSDYIEGAGDQGDGRWVVNLKKPIPLEWHMGIGNAVRKMHP